MYFVGLSLSNGREPAKNSSDEPLVAEPLPFELATIRESEYETWKSEVSIPGSGCDFCP